MKDISKRAPASQEEARRIIEEVDVGAFLKYIPWEMDPKLAAKRLMVYRDHFLPSGFNSPLFYLERNVYIGASEAGSLANLYAKTNGVDLQRELGFDMYFANTYEFIAEKIGRIDPSLPTPRAEQGLRLEPYLRSWLESEYGYQFLPEEKQAIMDHVDSSMPLFKVSPDGCAMVPIPDGKGGTRLAKATIEMKCTTPEKGFDFVADMHVFQKNAQLMQADAAGADIEFGVVVYYDYERALLHRHIVQRNDTVQEMIRGGYHLAVEHIDSQLIPNFAEEPYETGMNDDEKLHLRSLMRLTGTLGIAKKEVEKLYDRGVASIKDYVAKATPATNLGKLRAKDIVDDSPIPSAAFRLSSSLTLKPSVVAEMAKERGIYKDFISPGNKVEEISELRSLCNANGIDLDQYLNHTFDTKLAAEQLEKEFQISPLAMSDVKINAGPVDKVNDKNPIVKEYCQGIHTGVDQHLPTLLKEMASANEIDLRTEAQKKASDDQTNKKDTEMNIGSDAVMQPDLLDAQSDEKPAATPKM